MPERRPRSPGVLLAGIALAIAVLVAAIALSARQAPPPTIAEFAPQAVENIQDSPSDQNAKGPGGKSGPGATPTPTPEPDAPATIVPRVRKCIGDPPRQIEDPQSPPCVPYWAGDNGGATSRGVSRDEIRIAQPTSDAPYTITSQLAQFFNKRFEFYGRKLNVLPPIRNDLGLPQPDTQRADAVTADAQNVFASLYYRNSDGFPYRQELARRKVISMGIYAPVEHDYLAAFRPYMWQYHMEADRMFDGVGRWVCRRLAGGNAVHAGGAFATKPRVFGIVMQVPYEDDPTDSAALEAALQSQCGVRAAIKRRNPVRSSNGAHSQTPVDPVSSTNTMIAFRDAGVNSIICLCYIFSFGGLGNAAQAQDYHPEWLTSYSLDINVNYTLTTAQPDQLSHTFGLATSPMQVKPDTDSYWAAVKEADPAFQADDNNEVAYGYRSEEYHNMLLYASAIQMAGPHLTPQTFEAALHRTRFPNPPHPLMAGAVGFPREAHGMMLDFAEFWWSNNTRGPYQGDDNGTMCYVDGGRRYTGDQFPAGGDPFFADPCQIG